MKIIKKIAIIILSAALGCSITAALGACGSAGEEENNDAINVINVSDVKVDETSSSGAGSIKEETVTIKASADGTPLSATVKRSGDDLEEAVNVEELPFEVKITYFLNEEQIAPEDLAGATGRLRVRFDYVNTSHSEFEMYGEHVESMVPLTFLSMISLSEDRFSNIEVTNGDVTNMAGTNMVYGYAVPGLKDALGIDKAKDKLKEVSKAMEDEEEKENKDDEDEDETMFPEYMEFSADTENCKIEFTATIVMNGLFKDTKADDLDDIDEMIRKFGKFGEAGDELKDGVTELGNGAWELGEGISSYVDGTGSLADGSMQLYEGASALAGQNAALTGGAQQLAEGLTALSNSLTGIPGMEELKASVDALALGATSLSSGIGSYTGAVSQMADGAHTLALGAQSLASAGTGLKDGYWKLLEGISELKDGVSEMNDKMFQNISSLSEGALPEMTARYRILQQADKGFTAWNTYDGTEGSIRFILETESID